MFGLDKAPNQQTRHIADWNYILQDLGQKKEEGISVMQQMEQYRDIVEQEKQYKPRLYTYPNADQSVAVFDEEDMEDDEAILVLCVCADPENPDR